MKIRSRIIAMVAGLFALLALSQFVVDRSILLPSFTSVERHDAVTDMDRVTDALSRELDLLTEADAEYADWSDIYDYMQTRRFDDKVAKALSETEMKSLRADVLVLMDLDGRFVWKSAHQPGTDRPLELDWVARDALDSQHPWISAVRAGAIRQGLIATAHGPLLAALAPVLDGTGQGPARGVVLLGRFLTGAEIERMASQTHVKLDMGPVTRPEAGGGGRLLTLANGDRLLEGSLISEVFRTIEDIHGRPLFAFHIEVPRSVSHEGRQAILYAMLFMSASGIVLLFALLVLLNRAVIAPLGAMTRRVVAIGERDEMQQRLELSRRDEFGVLAKEFNRMLARLEAARQQLADRSYEAGIGEMASGVLHNIGNALTPLGVRVETLRGRLRAAPAADVEPVLAQMRQASPGSEERRDCEQLLQLLSQELAQLVVSGEADLASVKTQIDEVRLMISAQQKFARRAPVMEEFSLRELVSDAAEIIPKPLQQRVQVVVDPSVAAIGSVHTARVILRQVLQNALLNAAESIRDAGVTAGRIDVLARQAVAAGAPSLEMEIRDNGGGIAPEARERLFERGFSTKSAKSNSGLGLHWCANAIRSINGSIELRSEGTGKGSCMHLSLPLPSIPIQGPDSSPVERAA